MAQPQTTDDTGTGGGGRADATQKRVAVTIAALSAFLTPFMGSSVTIALPAIGQEFSMDAILLGWVATAYLLAAAMFLVPFGKAADLYGRKKVFTYGMWVYTISSLLCAVSTSAPLFMGFRVLQGIGSAMIFGTGVAILTSVFPAGERGRALGANVAATYLGLSLGPALGGLMTRNLGWRSIFLANVPLGLAVIALVLWKLRAEWAEARGESFDWLGSGVYGVSLVAVIYGFSSLPAAWGVGLIVGGAAGILAFVWWERRVQSPILNVGLFRSNRVFTFSNLAALINYSATYAAGFLLSLYLQYIKALDAQQAGLILVSRPIVMAAFSPLAGRLSDRVEPRLVASTGMALKVVALLLLATLDGDSSLTFVTAVLMLLGFGFALFSSPNTNAVMGSVERRLYGVASATLGTMRLTGQAFSIGVATLVFALYMGRVEITPEYYPLLLTSLRVAFLVFAAFCFGGTFASLARGRVH